MRKKINIILSLAFLFVLSNVMHAQCPTAGTMSLTAADTTYYAANGQNNISNVPATFSCTATPFYVYVTEMGGGLHSPCIKTEYNLYYTSLRNRATETFFEAGNNLGCVGPSGCFFPIGGTVPPISGASIWSVSLYGLDGSQSHDQVFSKTAGTWNTSTVTVQDCWSSATLPGQSGQTTPFAWVTGVTSFTNTVAPPANIGTAVFSISPVVSAPGFVDFGFGYCYADPSMMAPGTYTITYTFTAPGCAPVSRNRVFTVVNPYSNASWTAPTGLCNTSACVNLPPTVTGTAGGTWAGTGVSGTQFCPSTSGAGSFPVTYSVGISAACSGSQTNTITVSPTPTLTAVSSPTAICVGQNSVLTGNGATTYTWSANAGSVVAQTATVTPGVGTTVYTVTGTTGGCSSSATTTVTVNALPTVTATASPTSICTGQSATITASGATSYTWSTNEGGTSNNPTSVSPTSTDTYTVTGTDANGCVNTGQVTVNVTPTPTITLNPASATICAGTVVTCTATGATSYTWMPGSITTDNISVTPSGTTTYVVTGDNSGCTGTNTFVVTVNPLPSLTVTATPASICTGQTSTLTASGASTYTWSANAGGVTASSTTVSPTGNTTYTVTGDLGGCLDSTTITVNMGAAPVLSISASDTTICNGQSTTLTASGATNYTWSPGGTGAVISQSPTGTTTYTLIGDNSGCADTINFVVTVNPTPTVSAVSSPTAICSGQSSTLTASGAITYAWSANAGSVQTSTATVSPTSTSTYTVNGTDNNGCSASAQVTVSVTATPVVIALATPTVVCSGQQVQLVANGTATSYSWSTGATTQFTSDIPTANPTTYTVTGFFGTCSGFTTVTVAVVTQPTVTVAGSPTTLCSGQSATLTATYNPSTSTVNWSGGLGSNDTVVVTPSGTNTYTFTATNGACTDAQSVMVTVNPTPTMAPVSGQTVCSGNNVNAINFAPVNGTVNWTNTNTNIGLAASGSGSTIAGYQAPPVTAQQVGVITATPTNTTSGCTGASQTFTIVINALPVITPGITDSALCGMPTGGVSGISATGSAPLTYSWSNGSTSPNLSNVPAGNYTLTVTDVNGCQAGSTTSYAVGGTPAVIAAFTPSTNSGPATLNVNFTNNSLNGVNFNWNFGNGVTSTSTNSVVPATYVNGGDYVVTLIASAGTCTSVATDTIHVEQPIKIEFPNIFSPNGDNINEEFSFIVSGITELTCEIFNRWGQKVITMTGPTSKWDGKLDNGNAASEGTYFYTVIAKSYDGKTHNKQGTVTLVR